MVEPFYEIEMLLKKTKQKKQQTQVPNSNSSLKCKWILKFLKNLWIQQKSRINLKIVFVIFFFKSCKRQREISGISMPLPEVTEMLLTGCHSCTW